ncbi:acyltransferase [Nodosilinea sp. LEGE 07298]|uniref:acyltransferase n=1 Tax=Nodosilinea sp. LEGE 07298 TaxID=2777970 RepID=UPI001880B7A5|nr:acyltransferase [Nodosilinea sp. LEGE 07298]MBE9110548.1 acyltransferase [Nodosilinea sp. LEGE 07298]
MSVQAKSKIERPLQQATEIFPKRSPNTSLGRLAFLLLEPIPRPLGTALRKFAYPLLAKGWGKNPYIQAWVEILGVDKIVIGDNVRILRNSILNCNFENSLLKLGNNVSLDRGVSIRLGDNCTVDIGDDTYIGPYSCLSGPGHVKIGRDCLIASMAGIYANQHHHVGASEKGITIEDKCWIGSGAKILDGVTIGYGSAIGAGAVVTKDIPPYSVAVGVPAKVLENRKTRPDD